MQQPYVQCHVKDSIATITFFSPQHNSLPSAILQQLADTIVQANENDDCKVIVLQSAGEKTFCAGASFDELLQIENKEQGIAFFSGFAKVINAMRCCKKIIIGRIQGKAIGGGVGLAASCDYTMATQAAAIKLSELAVGIGPFVVGPAVERKIGTSAAFELAIDATQFRTAEWAKQKGLYAAVFESTEKLDEAIATLATTLASSSMAAMTAIKKAFWQGTENWNELLAERAAISGSLVISNETKTFLKAFKSK